MWTTKPSTTVLKKQTTKENVKHLFGSRGKKKKKKVKEVLRRTSHFEANAKIP
jgi:hypothetical protein